MNHREAIRRLRRAGATVTTKQAREAGLHWRDIYALRDGGELIELSRGVYRLADAGPTPYLDFVAVSKRFPRGTICLTSALSFWDLTDEMPDAVDLAVRRGDTRPRIEYPSTRLHVFSAETFDLGREEIKLDSGDELYIYSPERTIADMLRLRHKIGADLGLRALRRYLRRPGATPRRLLELARKLRSERVVADALEVLLS